MAFTSLATARAALWETSSKVPFVTATTADKLAVDTKINLACDRLLTQMNFRGSFSTARLRVFDEQITLPSPLDGIRSLRLVNSDGTLGRQYEVASQQSAFTPLCSSYDVWAGFPLPSGSTRAVVRDLGEGFPTFRDPTGTFYLRCKSTRAEAGTTILLRGLDENGAQVYSGTNTEGVSLTVSTATTTTTQKFTEFSSWVKAAATNGVIQLYAVDTTTGAEELLVNITPGKLTSGYRRYSAPGFEFGTTVEALCNIASMTAVADNDPVVPGNLGALKLAIDSLQYEDRNDRDNAKKYMADALDLLEMDRQRFDGDEVSPVPFIGFFGYNPTFAYGF